LERVERIRLEERNYHESVYEQHELFREGSWLHRPVRTVLEMLQLFENYSSLNVLDLGSGIGRNSIPIAQYMRGRKDGKVECVDLLETALNKLLQYSKQYGVEHLIEPKLSDLDHFRIEPNAYDYIIGVSALEHCSTKLVLEAKLQDMTRGTKMNGINCIIIGSNIKEQTLDGLRELDPRFEINLPEQEMLELLDNQYAGWEILKRSSSPLEFMIERESQPVKLFTTSITFAARKREERHFSLNRD
jgi:Predicted methyltransferase